ncbi:ADP-dependent (S)-NAD(P)H-hydrate dehydratase [Candidatus Methanobinarius endosymbioticus]|uniref:Bifunctional NAD(P)H-hydrate repair enzyme n=1 Tax=Candidatus Methanobinarius endosymbioticus TaxID=2006182 RepID=A0A366MBG5_9EURY|nr:ADP-dependent (S)-NAD(P)H-hydrate dehydratase [Candidatus Methanobinarius endosymbioticus]
MDPIDMMVADINCEDLGLSKLCLMENAGKCLSDEVATISTFTFSKPVKIAIFTGSSENGGDGFVAARHLLNRGFEVEVYMLTPPNDIKSIDAQINYDILNNMSPHISRLNIMELNDSKDVEKIDIANSKSFSEYIIIDGILGTGLRGKLKEKVRKTIEIINNSNALKIAIDVPSGMDPLTGEISDIAIKPEYTVTFHRVKTGVKKANNSDEKLIGGLVICDIGIPIEAELFVGTGDLLRLNYRKNSSHKGNNGKILIVGGSKDYHGAPAIAGISAISSGADLVYIASPKSVSLALKQKSLDLIVKTLNEGNEDYFSLDNLDEILNIIDTAKIDAVLLGPGVGQNDGTGKLFNTLAKKIDLPLVVDADALKLIDPILIKNKENLILTPHLNEFKSFFKKFINENEYLNLINDSDENNHDKLNNKIAEFQKITNNINGTVILKGKYDLVFNKNKLRINKTGNSGMTVGGTGDSLAGLSASLLSQGLNSYAAAALAVYLNGKAGDLAKESYGNGFSASQLSEFIGILMED